MPARATYRTNPATKDEVRRVADPVLTDEGGESECLALPDGQKSRHGRGGQSFVGLAAPERRTSF